MTKKMSFRFIVLLLVNVLICANGESLPNGANQENREAVVNYLRPVLMPGGGAGRIYYSTACDAKGGTPLAFPRVAVQAASKEKTGVAAVREIFKNDKHVTVQQDRSGMIRVTIGHPLSALLHTRIHSVTLKEHEQYNGELAVFAILNCKEIQAAMKRLGFDLNEPVTVFGGSINVPEEGVSLPHLPAAIKNVTMDQALDMVAKTFGGIVIYETCTKETGKRLVSLDFAQVTE